MPGLRTHPEIPHRAGSHEVTGLDKRKLAELRARAQTIQPTLHVGKDGVTEEVAEELGKQLKKHKLVKVRLLTSMEADRHDAGEQLARAASAVLVEVRGRTVVLAAEK